MRIETITYTKRHNEGDYSYSEYTLTAALEEGEQPLECLADLKNTVNLAINGVRKIPEVVKAPAEHQTETPKEVEAPKKAKKTKAAPVEDKKHGDVIDGQEVPPVIPSEAQEEMETVESPFQLPKDAIAYDLKNKDHRDRFAAYLTKSFPNWKTKPKEQLLAMSQELSGKAFEDKKGVMLDSFKNIVASFFE